eukprot:CAMPEP_0185037146 /NCGR_PEP_ID=MMETSP1103-20130426/31127_1 /TAXON_ID=36769 /ORGANISM="Paraphysomonas bandaiensis, Strain Caron Lab Isolate" /LENGTH=250 /DNA_ID=CAMNT_0027574977 /DNA_START=1 /DNA_END=753 /DNA_ORIENTATION=-
MSTPTRTIQTLRPSPVTPNASPIKDPKKGIYTRAELSLKKVPVTPLKPPTLTEDEKDGSKLPYEEYQDDLEVGAIFSRLDHYVVDIRHDEAHMKFRVVLTLFSWITCLIGTFLILFSRAETEAFQSQPKIFWLFVLGCVLEVPVILWFILLFCSSKKEWQRRKEIRRRRKQRLKDLEIGGAQFKGEVQDKRVERVLAAKMAKYEKQAEERRVYSGNPMGYPDEDPEDKRHRKKRPLAGGNTIKMDPVRPR